MCVCPLHHVEIPALCLADCSRLRRGIIPGSTTSGTERVLAQKVIQWCYLESQTIAFTNKKGHRPFEIKYKLNKSENATPELFAVYIKKICKPRMQMKVYLNF